MSQREIENLRVEDPIEWLRDKARRRVSVDVRSHGNAIAVIRICALAEAALKAELAVCECKHGGSGCHDEECPCAE